MHGNGQHRFHAYGIARNRDDGVLQCRGGSAWGDAHGTSRGWHSGTGRKSVHVHAEEHEIGDRFLLRIADVVAHLPRRSALQVLNPSPYKYVPSGQPFGPNEQPWFQPGYSGYAPDWQQKVQHPGMESLTNIDRYAASPPPSQLRPFRCTRRVVCFLTSIGDN